MELTEITDYCGHKWLIEPSAIKLVDLDVPNLPNVVYIYIENQSIALSRKDWEKFYMEHFVPEVC